MSTPAGAVAPFQGAVTGQVVDRKSETTHNFLNVVRKLIRDSNVYRSEQGLLDALAAVDSYSRSVLASDHVRVLTENDHAPVEDVRTRVAQGGFPAAVPSTVQIDYRQLAQAMYDIQVAQAEAARQQKSVDETS